MSRASTIRDLRTKARELESKKREIDKQVESIYTTLRIFEQSVDTAAAETVSPYAEELTNAMYDVLMIERPLHRNVLLDRVRERGIHIGGQKPVNTIGSYLSTDTRFKNVGRGIWSLAEEPVASEVEDEEVDAEDDHNNGWRVPNAA